MSRQPGLITLPQLEAVNKLVAQYRTFERDIKDLTGMQGTLRIEDTAGTGLFVVLNRGFIPTLLIDIRSRLAVLKAEIAQYGVSI